MIVIVKEKNLEEQKKVAEEMMSNLSRRPGVEHQNEIAAYKRRISKMSTEIKVPFAATTISTHNFILNEVFFWVYNLPIYPL